ncbi:MAG: ABC transporter ATP-binding protein [Defluviitaleaceae bacterium]|nr:ABC transporter ATP-binding protein [Defluviitaleaceae bacterium]
MIASMKNVIKRYGDTTALDHLNLDVTQGEILGLLGPNGAGKTTAIKVLCGLIDADAGDVEAFGRKQNIRNLETRRNIGLVTQEITVFSELSAIENLRYFGGLYGLRGAELAANVNEMLEFVGLTDRAKKRPGTFSGGMQRRLNIACALVHKPKLVIMDEPTVGIDPQSRNHILESVKKIAAKGTTVLYTSHYMEEVQAICDRISIMDAGRVIAEGTLDELMGRIKHEDRINLNAAIPSDALTEELRAISGVKSVTVQGNHYLIISGAGSGNLNRIMEITGRHGGVTSFSEDNPNLEDVFLTLTGKKLRDEQEGA